jgi:hypothetical protein
MDFDDMPDSYFAFLSNQKKLAEPDKLAADGRQSQPAAKSKVKSRASVPVMAPAGSKPSLPSLPSMQRPSVAPNASSPSGARLPVSGPRVAPSSTQPPSSPRLGLPNKTPSNSSLNGTALPAMAMRMQQAGVPPMAPSVAAPPRSNPFVFVLVGVLVIAIGVLAYFVLK